LYRVISDPRDPENAIVPSLALMLVFADGMIIESDNLEGLVTFMVGKEYLKANNEDKCLMRIKIARNYAMLVIQYNSTAVVTLNGKIIKNNYAVSEDDEDYKYTDEELKNAEIIEVDSDRNLILSLVKMQMIRVLEKVGSTIFLEKEDVVPEGNNYRDIIQNICN